VHCATKQYNTWSPVLMFPWRCSCIFCRNPALQSKMSLRPRRPVTHGLHRLHVTYIHVQRDRSADCRHRLDSRISHSTGSQYGTVCQCHLLCVTIAFSLCLSLSLSHSVYSSIHVRASAENIFLTVINTIQWYCDYAAIPAGPCYKYSDFFSATVFLLSITSAK